MMDAMPRPRPPYLSREVTRHGNAVWYVRRAGKRTRLHSKYGTPEFEAEYQAALADRQKREKGSAASGSLAWLIERYRETMAWNSLSLATRRQRENIFRQVVELGRHPTVRPDHAGSDCRWPGPARAHASAGTQFPRRHAGPLPLGA